MTRKDLAKNLAEKTGLSFKQAESIIIAFGKIVTEAMLKDEKVVYSNFGTFYTVHYPSKVIMHPKLGAKKKIIMLPTDVVKWMPSGNIKDMIKNDYTIESPTTHKSNLHHNIPIRINAAKKPAQTENIFEHGFDNSQPINSNPEEIPPIKKRISLLDSGILDKFSTQNLVKHIRPQAEKPLEVEPTDYPNDNASDSSDMSNQIIDPISIESIPPTEPTDNTTPDYVADLTPFRTIKNSITYIDLSAITIAKEILSLIPEKIAREYKIVPVEKDGKSLIVAMIDPEDIEAIEIVKKMTQRPIQARLATEADIAHVLDQYQGLESEVEEAISTNDFDNKKEEDTGALLAMASDSAPAARIVTSLLRRAIRDRASDIHIEPNEKTVEVRFRLDGILHKKVDLPKDVQAAIVSRIKILSNLKIDEQRLPQDGRFSLNIDDRRIDFRISTMPVANGEKVVMRVLDKLTGVLGLDQLGITGRDFDLLKENTEKSHGMILVTGPTGSGKTTTLYALLSKIYNEGVNIITLEDPIEYQIAGINQSQVNASINYTFASGLRSILRQDPDVIMIGEIRDMETAEMAVQSALTGHIVISTLHTNNAAGAAPRLIDMGVEPFLLISSLNLVVGQRLARKICDQCKTELKLSAEQLKFVNNEIAQMPEDEKKKLKDQKIKFYHGKGCKNCDETGYKGRIGLYELLDISETIKNMIIERASSTKIEQQAIKEGMKTMLQDGILKAIDGITTLEEVFRVIKD